MFRRALVTLLVLVVLVGASTGCTLSREGRRGAIIAGGVTAASSILLIRSGERDRDHNGINETILDDDWGAYMLGSAMFVGGIALLLGGLASREAPEPAPSVTYLPPASAMPVTEPPPVTVTTTTLAESSTTDNAPTQIVEIERVDVVPLPELPATAEVLRLAKQVRSAATHGRCEAAWIMWIDLHKLDAAYARALRDGRVMARCAE